MESNVFALWLPLNKDFFGFDNYWDAPLNIFSEINKTHYIEHPILLRSKEIIEKISFEDYPFEYKINSNEQYNDTTVRNVSFQINNKKFSNTVTNSKHEKIGTFTIFSHGLYLWQFEDKTSENNFLKHIEILFDTVYLDKRKNDTKNEINKVFFKGYKGILNYFQLELLLDVLYNIYIAPSVFFKIHQPTSNAYKNINKKFTLYNILYSIILVKINKKNLQPLSKRDKYRIRNKKSYLSASIEHFIRVANTFSLEHYRRGLDYCLKNLTEIGIIRTDIFEDGINYNFPSIINKSSMMRLESYHGMMYEKLPNLKYLNSLFVGLQKVYLPKKHKTLTQAIEQYNRRIETISNFFYSIEKLIEEENTKNIHYEIAELRKNNEISNQLAVENSEMQKEEMLEVLKRKDEQYTQKMFEAIQKNSDKIETMLKQTLEDNSASLNKGVYLLTIVTVEIALLTPIVTDKNINSFSQMWDKLSELEPYSKYLLIFFLLLGLYMIFSKPINSILSKILPKSIKDFTKDIYSKVSKSNNKQSNNEEIDYNNKEERTNNSKNHEKSLYVFDNSNIDIDHKIEGIYTKLIEFFHSEDSIISIFNMPSLLNMEEKIKCIKYNTIRERYRSYKLYKFTFVSDYDIDKKIKYTIDIDIQYDTIGDNDTKINNIRIAIIDEDRLNENELKKVYNNMKEIKNELSTTIFNKFKNDEAESNKS